MGKSPMKKIREKCLDCSGGSHKVVRYCTAYDCPLWDNRFDIRPSTAREKHGEEFLNPVRMPDANIPIEELP